MGQLRATARPAGRLEVTTPVERGCAVVKLVRIEPATQSIELEYRSRRILGATYTTEAEATLLRHPKEGLIEVRGNICYDSAGEPVSIDDIDEVAELDESPIEVKEVVYRDVRHVATPPLHFDVVFDRADALYDLQGPFDVLLWADSREELADALEAEFNLLFADYAEEDPSHLSSGAKRLRDQIRDRFGLG